MIRPPTIAEWTLCLAVWALALYGAVKGLQEFRYWVLRFYTRWLNSRLTRWRQ